MNDISNNQNVCSLLQIKELTEQQQFFVKSSLQIKNQRAVVFIGIFPINETGNIIRLKNQSLRVNLSQLILKQQIHIASSGFSYKINPSSGVFFLQFSFIMTVTQAVNSQKIKYYQDKILQKIKNNETLRKSLINVVKLIKNDTIFTEKDEIVNQIKRYAFNSQFYAWTDPNSCYLDKEKTKSSKKQLEVWSDCDSDNQLNKSGSNQSEESNNQSQNSFQKAFQKQKSTEQSIQFSNFYTFNRKVYNELSLNSKAQEDLLKSRTRMTDPKQNPLVKYFISQNQDMTLYTEYLQKYETMISLKIKNPNKNSQNQSQHQNYQQKDNPLRIINQLNYGAKVIFQNSSHSNQQNSFDSQEQFLQLTLDHYFQNNRYTISKSTKWQIAIQVIKIIYLKFLKGELSSKKIMFELKIISIDKGLWIKIIEKQKKTLIEFLGRKSSNLNNFYYSQYTLESQMISQQKLGLFLLKVICLIMFEKRYISSKIIDMPNNFCQLEFYRILSIDRFFDEESSRFKFQNIDVQLAFLYLYERSKLMKYGPLGDWIVIISQFIQSKINGNCLIEKITKKLNKQFIQI